MPNRARAAAVDHQSASSEIDSGARKRRIGSRMDMQDLDIGQFFYGREIELALYRVAAQRGAIKHHAIRIHITQHAEVRLRNV